MRTRSWLGCIAAIAAGMALVACASEPHPIDLATTLRLGGARAFAVEAARERVRQSRARLDQDRLAAWPWLAPGIAYRRHDGYLQDIVGDVFDASKHQGSSSLGLQAQVDPGDAWYRVLASRQALRAVEADADAQGRQSLLAAAQGYVELSRAAALVAASGDAVRVASETLRKVENATVAGVASEADAQRARLRHGRVHAAHAKALADHTVASARLAELLRLPPSTLLAPDLREFVPTSLLPPERPLDALVAAALAARPELQRARAAIGEAGARRDGVHMGPWIPSVGASAGAGGIMGGRNGGLGSGGAFGDYGFGVAWRIGPGGIGDRTRVRAADAAVRLAEIERDQAAARITREVVELHSRAAASAGSIGLASSNIVSARRLLAITQGRKDFGFGAVTDVLEAERELAGAQAEGIDEVAAHNQFQWRLWHASGEPLRIPEPPVASRGP